MRILALTTAAAAVAFTAAPAAAQIDPSWYGSVGVANVSAEDTDVDLNAVTGRLGARLNPYFGVEGEASFGLGDESVAPGVDAELSHDASAYAVGYYPISNNFEVFGRVGYGTTEIEVSGAGSSVSENEDSLNYGVGAQYFFDGANGVRGDWTRRDFRDDAGEADVWSISYVRRF
ncbi:porin family protein [Brevundimonas sp.]|uniref:porin family protein n=1 Tax=Brevundimonas sp. TaxID=1871086 RepID=UPI0025CE93B7|nr:porin family protein [Brevundimonas sp.]